MCSAIASNFPCVASSPQGFYEFTRPCCGCVGGKVHLLSRRWVGRCIRRGQWGQELLGGRRAVESRSPLSTELKEDGAREHSHGLCPPLTDVPVG